MSQHLIVNGDERTVDASTVAELLAELGLRSDRTAVELNNTIIARDSHKDTPLADGDRLEVVSFVSGG